MVFNRLCVECHAATTNVVLLATCCTIVLRVIKQTGGHRISIPSRSHLAASLGDPPRWLWHRIGKADLGTIVWCIPLLQAAGSRPPDSLMPKVVQFGVWRVAAICSQQR